jgi:hypothetical protein
MKNEIDVIARFRAICGEYSMNKMVIAADGSWVANLYRGTRKIAEAKGDNVLDPTGMAVTFFPNVDSGEREALLKWANNAGPFGFFSSESFVAFLFCRAQMLLKMRDAARRGYLVAFSKSDLDENEMPTEFKTSKRKVGPEWLNGYAKSYPNMQVANHQVV